MFRLQYINPQLWYFPPVNVLRSSTASTGCIVQPNSSAGVFNAGENTVNFSKISSSTPANYFRLSDSCLTIAGSQLAHAWFLSLVFKKRKSCRTNSGSKIYEGHLLSPASFGKGLTGTASLQARSVSRRAVDNRDLKIYDAAARRHAFTTKDIFIEDNSHE